MLNQSSKYGVDTESEKGKTEDHRATLPQDRPNSLPYYPRLWSSGTGVLSRDSTIIFKQRRLVSQILLSSGDGLSQNGYGSHNSDFLSLPDHVTQYGPVRAQTLGLYIPDSIRAWLLSGAPRIYDRKDLDLPGNRQLALPSILKRYFCGELTIHQFESLLNALKMTTNWMLLPLRAVE